MMKRTLALVFVLSCVGCVKSSDSPPADLSEETMTDEEVELQAEIDVLGADIDGMRAEVDAGFEETEALQQRLERDQREGDSLRERIEANQREIDAMMGQ